MTLLSLHQQIQFQTRRLFETGDNLFAQSFKPGDLSDEDNIPPMPNATCKMRAGCGVVATYKSKAGIACAEHAMEDMHPSPRAATRNRNRIHDK